MSIRLIDKIWYCTLETVPKIVLLALADHADDNGGSCYPSIQRLQIKTGLSRRAVQKYLAKFRESGVLKVIAPATRHAPTRYRIDINRLTFQGRTLRNPASEGLRSAPKDLEGCTPDMAGAHKLCTQTIIDPSKESSSTLQAAEKLAQLGGNDSPFEHDEPIEEDSQPSCCDQESGECTSEPCEAEADERRDFEAETTDKSTTASEGATRPEEGGDDKARFRALKTVILTEYSNANRGRACPWGGAEGFQLRATLNRLHSWPIDDLRACVAHRFASDVNVAESPKKWLPRLEDYANGRLNKYGKRELSFGELREELIKLAKERESRRKQADRRW